MLNSLKAITVPRDSGMHWAVEHDTIVQKPRANHRLANLVEFIRCVNFANSKLSSVSEKTISQHDAERIFTPLAETSIKLQLALQKQSRLVQLIVTIVQFIFTGTTLAASIASLKTTMIQNQGLENSFAAKLAYPQLMSDAAYAQLNRSAYFEVAKRYSLPSVCSNSRTSSIGQCIINPLLYHLKQTFTYEWQEMRRMIRQGKTLKDSGVQDKSVQEHCDRAIGLLKALTNLSLSHELAALHDKNNPGIVATKAQLARQLGSQRGYPYWMLNLAGQFYKWIRSFPTYSIIDNRWHSSYAENRPFMEQFYQEGTRASFWCNTYNDICRSLDEHVDRAEFLSQDSRFYLDEDSPSMLEKVNHEFLNDDYFETQLFTTRW